MDDKQKELERIDQELEALLRESKETEPAEEQEAAPVPAFEDPDRILDPKEPLVYCNFSNDYGRDLEEALKEEKPRPAPKAVTRESASSRKKDDKVIIGLMLAVSMLCVGILGVFIYWLETLLKLL